MSEVYKDFLGQEVGVGDFVVYATTSGKSPVQKYAEVVKIDTVRAKRTVFDQVIQGYRTVEYTKYKVGVKEIKNGRGFTRWDSYTWERNEDGSYKRGEDGRMIRVDKTVRTTYPMPDNIVKVFPPLDS